MFDHSDFFLKPLNALQRQYEALRAFYVEKKSAREVSGDFGFTQPYFNKLRYLFHQSLTKGQTPVFFAQNRPGPRESPQKPRIKERIVELRKKNYSILDIKATLNSQGVSIGLSQIDRLLKAEGFSRLPRRSKGEREKIGQPRKFESPKAERLDFNQLPQKTFTTRYGGAFLFLPFIKEINLPEIVEKAEFPQTSRLSNFNYIMSFLFLKLIAKERLSHVNHLSLDAGAGLFASLSVLPKSSSLSSYAYNTTREMDRLFLKELFVATQKIAPFSGDVNLDFTAIPHWGDQSVLEKNWLGKRRVALKSVLALVAQDPDTGILPYSNAEVRHHTKNDEVLHFVDFWRETSQEPLKCLIFDSKFTTYENLSKLNSGGVKFITLRRRGKKLVSQVAQIPSSPWQIIKMDNLKRKYRRLRVCDSKIYLPGYRGKIRQLIITNNGREKPAFIITNELAMATKDIVWKYARRWLVEKSISEQIYFFHLNMVSSSIVVKVDFDLTMTVLANTLYRLLASKLVGFEKSSAKTLFSNFIDNVADVQIAHPKIKIILRKKAHNPIIFGAELFNQEIPIPWYGDYLVCFDCQNTT